MTIFYICRHGETENNRKLLLSGWYDTPLIEEGVQQAEACAQKLVVAAVDFDKVITSDLGRAIATAEIINRSLGISDQVERYEGLREVNYGDFANQPISTYPQLTPEENANFVPPNGESLVQMQQRVMDCLHTIAIANPDKTILIVAHDGTINAVRSAYNNENIGITDSTNRNEYDMVGRFEFDGSRVTSFTVL
jgi:broad specificity phosphatase PhoE